MAVSTAGTTEVNGAAGGWTVSGILLEQSGQFLNATYSGVDILHNRNRGGRPDCVVGGSLYPADQSISNYFNRAAFAIPAPGTFGDCPRNVLNGPGINSVNLSLQKSFKLSERASLRIHRPGSGRAEPSHLQQPEHHDYEWRLRNHHQCQWQPERARREWFTLYPDRGTNRILSRLMSVFVP